MNMRLINRAYAEYRRGDISWRAAYNMLIACGVHATHAAEVLDGKDLREGW